MRHLPQVGNIGIIQIFVKLCHGFVYGHAQHIDFRGNAEGFGHLDVAASAALAAGFQSRTADRILLKQLQVAYVHLGAQDAHLDKYVALGVRKAADGTI